MDISIIIVNFNSFQMLKECLDSIVKHTNPKIIFEIIIIDNNSNEGNIRSFLKDYSQVKLVINTDNRGFAAANNQGIKIAKGKYILFLNNDTLFLEDSISKILAFLGKNGQNSIIGCRLLNGDRSHQASVVDRDSLSNSFGENFFLYLIFKKIRALNKYYLSSNEPDSPSEVDIIKGAFIFCTKKIVDELSGFDERFFFYSEETDLCIRAILKGYKIYYFPQTQIIHYGGYATDKNLWFKFKNQTTARIQIFQKHYSGLSFFLLISFHFVGIFIRIFVYFLGGIVTLSLPLVRKSWYYFRQLYIYPKNLFK
ncbi:MAG: glycosyltransferase family 2 protein [Clostridiaceae bacterium]|nr:glycosyltransferase family 2 protein [Clostridiaceae bacterium]